MLRRLPYFFLILMMVSCDTRSVYSSFKSINESWKEGEKIEFNFEAPDSINNYNLFLYVRNDENYAFSNLFLIVNMDFPDLTTITDTLQYEMAEPDGTWLGDGFTATKESKLWYKENIIFPVNGEYKVHVEHAMRINGKVEGIKALQGINDIGFKVESAKN